MPALGLAGRRRTRECAGALVCCTLLSTVWQRAGACSLATPTDPIDGFVLYGEVVAHVEAPFRTGSTFGIEIVPRVEFRVPRRTSDGTYAAYYFGLAPDCRPEATTAEEVAERFKIGSIIAVLGLPADTAQPGDIDVGHTGLLHALDPRCDAVALALRKHDYRELDVPCGSYRFEANKDVAMLETASPSERLDILERLAEYQGLVLYLDLLAKYAPEASTGRRLRDQRYGDMITLSCLMTYEEREALELEWQQLARWGEYCIQDDPYDSLPADTWNLYDAIAQNRISVVEDFLSSGGDPGEPLRGTPGGSVYPVWVAIAARNESIALALLRAGADFERSRMDLYSVAMLGMARVMDYLLTQSPARLPSALESIPSACQNGFYDVVDVVIRHAREQSATIAWPDYLIDNCVSNGADSARLLIDQGAPVTRSALWSAARYGSTGMVRHLIAHGADPAERYSDTGRGDINGFAAIDFALREYEFLDEPARKRVHYVLHELAVGPPPLNGTRVEALARNAYEDLESYADPADRLEFAARFGLYDAVEALLVGDAFSPDVLRSAVRAALEGRNPDVARLLVASGTPVGGGTLHIAVETGRAGFVKHLLALGADVNERVGDATPLESWLASWRDDEVLRVLVMAGADLCGTLPKFDPDATYRIGAIRAAAGCAP
jgi:ankyrin repeat protein